jgi:hypothetical protein
MKLTDLMNKLEAVEITNPDSIKVRVDGVMYDIDEIALALYDNKPIVILDVTPEKYN